MESIKDDIQAKKENLNVSDTTYMRPLSDINTLPDDDSLEVKVHFPPVKFKVPIVLGLQPLAIFSCDLCNHFCEEFSQVELHVKQHIEKRSICEVCGRGFSRGTDLKRHRRLHTGEKPYLCHHCGESVIDSSALSKHVQVYHATVKRHTCDLCGKGFVNKKCFENHQRKHEDRENSSKCRVSRPKIYQCEVCSSMFATRWLLKNHQQIHFGELYACNICGRKFNRRSNLKCHENIHQGVRPYKCDICDYSCAHGSNLIKHKRRHADDMLRFDSANFRFKASHFKEEDKKGSSFLKKEFNDETQLVGSDCGEMQLKESIPFRKLEMGDSERGMDFAHIERSYLPANTFKAFVVTESNNPEVKMTKESFMRKGALGGFVNTFNRNIKSKRILDTEQSDVRESKIITDLTKADIKEFDCRGNSFKKSNFKHILFDNSNIKSGGYGESESLEKSSEVTITNLKNVDSRFMNFAAEDFENQKLKEFKILRPAPLNQSESQKINLFDLTSQEVRLNDRNRNVELKNVAVSDLVFTDNQCMRGSEINRDLFGNTEFRNN